jgi:hypothetical protein
VNDYVLTWTENEQTCTVYLRVSKPAATAIAEALKSNSAFTDVVLSEQVTTTKAVSI